MATVAESSEANPIPPAPPASPSPSPSSSEGNLNHNNNSAKTLDETTMLWVEYAVHQAQLYQKAIKEALDSAFEVSRSRLSQIHSTSSAHFNQTISDYATYEDLLVGKIKEGVVIASSHPLITGGVAAGLGLTVLKRPRRFLYYKTLRLFASEEKRALHGEEELLRGRTKLRQAGKQIQGVIRSAYKIERQAGGMQIFSPKAIDIEQAGKQIQGVIRSAYKIERQAGGLKDILGELPRTQASMFRSQVSKLASEAKRERVALTKEVTKISNYGISVSKLASEAKRERVALTKEVTKISNYGISV
ncbi:rgs1-hxk1-interacting protein 1 [Quercus suber]|uniref:Rgs1-hxk1-interacting protein 1 n=1 Tax=Quercus suber TaxID=58331 RepID=A0AAW0KF26_QUESU